MKIGVNYVGFVSCKDHPYLNIRGCLTTEKGVQIGHGCRIDIGIEASVRIGANTYINPFTKIIIMHGLSIGNDCAISWDCQFLNEDFHHLDYDGKRKVKNGQITVGDHVWIGSHVHIYKGTQLPNNCIVAANSVVRGIFLEGNCLIADNPARIIKPNIEWS